LSQGNCQEVFKIKDKQNNSIQLKPELRI